MCPIALLYPARIINNTLFQGSTCALLDWQGPEYLPDLVVGAGGPRRELALHPPGQQQAVPHLQEDHQEPDGHHHHQEEAQRGSVSDFYWDTFAIIDWKNTPFIFILVLFFCIRWIFIYSNVIISLLCTVYAWFLFSLLSFILNSPCLGKVKPHSNLASLPYSLL